MNPVEQASSEEAEMNCKCGITIERSTEDGEWNHVADWAAVEDERHTDPGALASMDHQAEPDA